MKLRSDVWIVLGLNYGARRALLNTMLHIPSINLNSGKMDHFKMFPCVTLAMLSALVTQSQPQVHVVSKVTIYLEIDG